MYSIKYNLFKNIVPLKNFDGPINRFPRNITDTHVTYECKIIWKKLFEYWVECMLSRLTEQRKTLIRFVIKSIATIVCKNLCTNQQYLFIKIISFWSTLCKLWNIVHSKHYTDYNKKSC